VVALLADWQRQLRRPGRPHESSSRACRMPSAPGLIPTGET
jgi:hypothetical protein